MQVGIGVPTLGPVGYSANPAASRFFLVDLDLRWVTQAPPTLTSRDVDAYTRADHLQYILEADSAGKIVGGEWLGVKPAPTPGLCLVAAGCASAKVVRRPELRQRSRAIDGVSCMIGD